MKDGRTHLAHKAEHAVDLETGAVLAVCLRHPRIWRFLASNSSFVTIPRSRSPASFSKYASESAVSALLCTGEAVEAG